MKTSQLQKFMCLLVSVTMTLTQIVPLGWSQEADDFNATGVSTPQKEIKADEKKPEAAPEEEDASTSEIFMMSNEGVLTTDAESPKEEKVENQADDKIRTLGGEIVTEEEEGLLSKEELAKRMRSEKDVAEQARAIIYKQLNLEESYVLDQSEFRHPFAASGNEALANLSNPQVPSSQDGQIIFIHKNEDGSQASYTVSIDAGRLLLSSTEEKSASGQQLSYKSFSYDDKGLTSQYSVIRTFDDKDRVTEEASESLGLNAKTGEMEKTWTSMTMTTYNGNDKTVVSSSMSFYTDADGIPKTSESKSTTQESYDANGNLLKQEQSWQSFLDGQDQGHGTSSRIETRNDAGKLLSAVSKSDYQYPQGQSSASTSEQTFEYDAAGNLLREIDIYENTGSWQSSSKTETTYTRDEAGRVLEKKTVSTSTGPNYSYSNETLEQSKYDAAGNEVSKHVTYSSNGAVSSETTTTRTFLTDAAGVITDKLVSEVTESLYQGKVTWRNELNITYRDDGSMKTSVSANSSFNFDDGKETYRYETSKAFNAKGQVIKAATRTFSGYGDQPLTVQGRNVQSFRYDADTGNLLLIRGSDYGPDNVLLNEWTERYDPKYSPSNPMQDSGPGNIYPLAVYDVVRWDPHYRAGIKGLVEREYISYFASKDPAEAMMASVTTDHYRLDDKGEPNFQETKQENYTEDGELTQRVSDSYDITGPLNYYPYYYDKVLLNGAAGAQPNAVAKSSPMTATGVTTLPADRMFWPYPNFSSKRLLSHSEDQYKAGKIVYSARQHNTYDDSGVLISIASEIFDGTKRYRIMDRFTVDAFGQFAAVHRRVLTSGGGLVLEDTRSVEFDHANGYILYPMVAYDSAPMAGSSVLADKAAAGGAQMPIRYPYYAPNAIKSLSVSIVRRDHHDRVRATFEYDGAAANVTGVYLDADGNRRAIDAHLDSAGGEAAQATDPLAEFLISLAAKPETHEDVTNKFDEKGRLIYQKDKDGNVVEVNWEKLEAVWTGADGTVKKFTEIDTLKISEFSCPANPMMKAACHGMPSDRVPLEDGFEDIVTYSTVSINEGWKTTTTFVITGRLVRDRDFIPVGQMDKDLVDLIQATVGDALELQGMRIKGNVKEFVFKAVAGEAHVHLMRAALILPPVAIQNSDGLPKDPNMGPYPIYQDFNGHFLASVTVNPNLRYIQAPGPLLLNADKAEGIQAREVIPGQEVIVAFEFHPQDDMQTAVMRQFADWNFSPLSLQDHFRTELALNLNVDFKNIKIEKFEDGVSTMSPCEAGKFCASLVTYNIEFNADGKRYKATGSLNHMSEMMGLFYEVNDVQPIEDTEIPETAVREAVLADLGSTYGLGNDRVQSWIEKGLMTIKIDMDAGIASIHFSGEAVGTHIQPAEIDPLGEFVIPSDMEFTFQENPVEPKRLMPIMLDPVTVDLSEDMIAAEPGSELRMSTLAPSDEADALMFETAQADGEQVEMKDDAIPLMYFGRQPKHLMLVSAELFYEGPVTIQEITGESHNLVHISVSYDQNMWNNNTVDRVSMFSRYCPKGAACFAADQVFKEIDYNGMDYYQCSFDADGMCATMHTMIYPPAPRGSRPLIRYPLAEKGITMRYVQYAGGTPGNIDVVYEYTQGDGKGEENVLQVINKFEYSDANSGVIVKINRTGAHGELSTLTIRGAIPVPSSAVSDLNQDGVIDSLDVTLSRGSIAVIHLSDGTERKILFHTLEDLFAQAAKLENIKPEDPNYKEIVAALDSAIAELRGLGEEFIKSRGMNKELEERLKKLNQILNGKMDPEMLLMRPESMPAYEMLIARLDEIAGALKKALDAGNLDDAKALADKAGDAIGGVGDMEQALRDLIAAAVKRHDELPGLISDLEAKIKARDEEWAAAEAGILAGYGDLVLEHGEAKESIDFQEGLYPEFVGHGDALPAFRQLMYVKTHLYEVKLSNGESMMLEFRNGVLNPRHQAMLDAVRLAIKEGRIGDGQYFIAMDAFGKTTNGGLAITFDGFESLIGVKTDKQGAVKFLAYSTSAPFSENVTTSFDAEFSVDALTDVLIANSDLDNDGVVSKADLNQALSGLYNKMLWWTLPFIPNTENAAVSGAELIIDDGAAAEDATLNDGEPFKEHLLSADPAAGILKMNFDVNQDGVFDVQDALIILASVDRNVEPPVVSYPTDQERAAFAGSELLRFNHADVRNDSRDYEFDAKGAGDVLVSFVEDGCFGWKEPNMSCTRPVMMGQFTVRVTPSAPTPDGGMSIDLYSVDVDMATLEPGTVIEVPQGYKLRIVNLAPNTSITNMEDKAAPDPEIQIREALAASRQQIEDLFKSVQVGDVISESQFDSLDKLLEDLSAKARAILEELRAKIQALQPRTPEHGGLVVFPFQGPGSDQGLALEHDVMSRLTALYTQIMQSSVRIETGADATLVVSVKDLAAVLMSEMERMGSGRWLPPEGYLVLAGLDAKTVGEFHPGEGNYLMNVFQFVNYMLAMGPSLRDIRGIVINFVKAHRDFVVRDGRVSGDLFRMALHNVPNLLQDKLLAAYEKAAADAGISFFKAPNIKILSIQFVPSTAAGTAGKYVLALTYSADNGAVMQASAIVTLSGKGADVQIDIGSPFPKNPYDRNVPADPVSLPSGAEISFTGSSTSSDAGKAIGYGRITQDVITSDNKRVITFISDLSATNAYSDVKIDMPAGQSLDLSQPHNIQYKGELKNVTLILKDKDGHEYTVNGVAMGAEFTDLPLGGFSIPGFDISAVTSIVFRHKNKDGAAKRGQCTIQFGIKPQISALAAADPYTYGSAYNSAALTSLGDMKQESFGVNSGFVTLENDTMRFHLASGGAKVGAMFKFTAPQNFSNRDFVIAAGNGSFMEVWFQDKNGRMSKQVLKLGTDLQNFVLNVGKNGEEGFDASAIVAWGFNMDRNLNKTADNKGAIKYMLGGSRLQAPVIVGNSKASSTAVQVLNRLSVSMQRSNNAFLTPSRVQDAQGNKELDVRFDLRSSAKALGTIVLGSPDPNGFISAGADGSVGLALGGSLLDNAGGTGPLKIGVRLIDDAGKVVETVLEVLPNGEINNYKIKVDENKEFHAQKIRMITLLLGRENGNKILRALFKLRVSEMLELASDRGGPLVEVKM
ncbi:MAG TPA: hypothetical protein VL688_00295 [Verrucomicrobiae bacterium]|nr:hypothetical protein [Verrucomicrobiae bacterium]